MATKLDAGNPGYAANCAKNSRTARAGMFDGGKPPAGPKPEPVKLNGVNPPKTSHVK